MGVLLPGIGVEFVIDVRQQRLQLARGWFAYYRIELLRAISSGDLQRHRVALEKVDFYHKEVRRLVGEGERV